ncbi:MAG: AmmeMemoRadiSam system radical SAM enzyme [Anaerolineae bacterium]|nr:AmmeMemoRadiSam system radical SAM enzyme [Candidatus Roseilinea sp.]MDW8450864.1 AmmeMemoRadiSam system radical SAM enzyme [Anaerolineae bacterium]
MAKQTLGQVLDALTVEGELYTRQADGSVACYACGHRCLIRPGRRGICKVRFNAAGTLRVPWGYVGALQCDPTEKKPFFHVYPGSDTLTFGMLGCDMHCPYCQNWVTSQALRDPASELAGAQPVIVTPKQLVALAKRQGAQLVGSSYNEPLITSEWAVAIFKEAVQAGLKCVYISNGNATREVLEYIRPYVVAYKIDLKTMSDKNYRRLGAVLQRVLDGIRLVHALGFWLEIVTLVIPGFNDSDAELRDAANFIAALSPDIPWHVTAFHKDYKMTDPDDTDARTLLRAAEIGRTAGLRYVYAGNLPGRVGEFEHTFCPTCGTTLIERYGYVILGYHLTAEGACPQCRTCIPGLWTDRPQTVRLYGPGRPRMVTA